jgi:hypothetical protein
MCSLVALYPFIPESPRYLLQRGRGLEAQTVGVVDLWRPVTFPQVLEITAKKNGAILPEGTLILPEEEVMFSYCISQYKYSLTKMQADHTLKQSLLQLVGPAHRIMTFMLWLIWFCNAFSYFGIILVTPGMNQYFEKYNWN